MRRPQACISFLRLLPSRCDGVAVSETVIQSCCCSSALALHGPQDRLPSRPSPSGPADSGPSPAPPGAAPTESVPSSCPCLRLPQASPSCPVRPLAWRVPSAATCPLPPARSSSSSLPCWERWGSPCRPPSRCWGRCPAGGEGPPRPPPDPAPLTPTHALRQEAPRHTGVLWGHQGGSGRVQEEPVRASGRRLERFQQDG